MPDLRMRALHDDLHERLPARDGAGKGRVRLRYLQLRARASVKLRSNCPGPLEWARARAPGSFEESVGVESQLDLHLSCVRI